MNNTGFDAWALSLIVFLPLVGAAIVMLLPKAEEAAIKTVALLTALALPLVLVAPGDAPPGPPPWLTDLPAAVAVAALARRTGHLLLAVVGGVLFAATLRALLG